jgi:hypothetical protein
MTVWFVCCPGCLMPSALLCAIMSPTLAHRDYARMSARWPHAMRISQLYVLTMEAGSCGILLWAVGLVLIGIGQHPVLTFTNPFVLALVRAGIGAVGVALVLQL